MKYSVRQNWVKCIESILTRPIVLLPFIIIAFLEGLALELIYFSPRRPISFALRPIVRKFFGEGFTHYPNNLLLLPKLFHYAEIAIYVIIGIFLAAISINIFRNVTSNLPLKTNALIKNAARRYLSFSVYGILVVLLVFLLKKGDVFILSKIFRLAAKYAPNVVAKSAPFIVPIFLFLTNVIMQVFLILVLPIIVLQKRSLLRALAGSIYLGLRNFFSLFALLFVPFLLYLPIFLLKNFSSKLVNLTFPEINLYITIAGIVIAMFVDCFVILCASHWLLERESSP